MKERDLQIDHMATASCEAGADYDLIDEQGYRRNR